MVKELMIFILTVWKGVSQWRTSKSPLIHTLYRDGVLYFLVVFVISLINFVMSIMAPKQNQTMLAFLMPEVQRILHSICTSHIILNLRKASAGDSGLGFDDGPGIAMTYMSTVRFGFNRRKQEKPKAVPVAANLNDDDEMDFVGSTTVKSDNWPFDTYDDTFAMTETVSVP